MATTEERLKILKMIEEGKINAEDGAKLLAALAEPRKAVTPPPINLGGTEARWFRVRVTDRNTGKPKVHVNIPVGLVNVGLRMGARFAPGVDQSQMQMVMEALKSGATGKVLEATDEETGELVEIFVE